MKHIIPNEPHIRYQADLWELSKEIEEIVTKLEYRYILEIKDCLVNGYGVIH